MSRQRGFALIAVLLVLAMLGILGAEFAYSMRLEATSVRAYKDTLTAAHLAEAGVEQAIREIAGDVMNAVLAEDGSLTFYNRERLELKRLPRTNVPLGAGQFSYRITDEEARLNLNTSPPACVVLRALAFGDAECSAVEQARRDGPYTTVPGQFGGRGLSLTTRTYRVEAEGIIDGQPRARLTAIIQRRTDSAGDNVTVLEWSGIR